MIRRQPSSETVKRWVSSYVMHILVTDREWHWYSCFGPRDSGCRVQGAGFRVQGAGFRVQGAGFRVQGSGCRVQGSGFRVKDCGFMKGPSRVLGAWREGEGGL